jgi:hypothetical protein
MLAWHSAGQLLGTSYWRGDDERCAWLCRLCVPCLQRASLACMSSTGRGGCARATRPRSCACARAARWTWPGCRCRCERCCILRCGTSIGSAYCCMHVSGPGIRTCAQAAVYAWMLSHCRSCWALMTGCACWLCAAHGTALSTSVLHSTPLACSGPTHRPQPPPPQPPAAGGAARTAAVRASPPHSQRPGRRLLLVGRVRGPGES